MESSSSGLPALMAITTRLTEAIRAYEIGLVRRGRA
jgi:hypothetical protein